MGSFKLLSRPRPRVSSTDRAKESAWEPGADTRVLWLMVDAVNSSKPSRDPWETSTKEVNSPQAARREKVRDLGNHGATTLFRPEPHYYHV
jgi:hypothetical protein